MNIKLKRLIFYWIVSFTISVTIYYTLWLIMPNHRVFGALMLMYLYHYEYPISFISIPCFFFGILATMFTDRFIKKPTGSRVLLLVLILFLTILFSSPFGGMLWYFYFRHGCLPENWFTKIIITGAIDGLEIGWLIILLSVPYNILVAINWYYTMVIGSKLITNIENIA